MTSLQTKDARRRKQIRILAVLVFGLALILFNPIIRLGIEATLPREPVRLGAVGISIPKSWMLSRDSTKVAAWRPCNTILCGSSPRASFTIETSELPASSDEVWRNAARKIIRENFPASANVETIYNGPLKCVELDAATPSGESVSSCLNADLGLASTFVGEPALKPAFYGVLASARKIP
jgi:hypothetical protein